MGYNIQLREAREDINQNVMIKQDEDNSQIYNKREKASRLQIFISSLKSRATQGQEVVLKQI